MWQDHVIATVQFFLTISLLPMVFKKGNKPTLLTSIPTSVGIAIIAYAFFTLGLWFTVATSSLASFLWFVLVYQKIFSKRLNK